MVTKNQILDMTPIGMVFTVLQTASDTNGKSLDLHWELLPGCNMKDPLIHIHPHATESYEILEGEMEFFIKDKWIEAKTGDSLRVPMGVTHTFRNPGNSVVKVFNTHQPALRMENYFEDICKILDKISSDRQKKVRMNLKAKLYMSVLMNNYRNEIIARNPPDIAIKTLGVLASLLKINY
jgi:mannose-6-phosphate isomerase-like protein (cupin superfamily)